jgi:Single-strand binding protein family
MRVLLSGSLVKSEAKTAASGSSYAKVTVRIDAQPRNESEPAQQFVWCVAFNDCATELLAMKPGDAIAIAGKLTVSANMYQDRPQAALNVVIDKLITAARPPRPQRSAAEAAFRSHGEGVATMRDDVPFG